MTSTNLLIDTNVFIGLEDPHEVPEKFAALEQIARKHGVKVFIHEAARDDLERDSDSKRRAISLSKIEKFIPLKKTRTITPEKLEAAYGPFSRHNDIVDSWLLFALEQKAADFLVTEDAGLHSRAARKSDALAKRVLYVADALSLLRTTYEPKEVPVRHIEEQSANEIPPEDEIFDSLRAGYPEFDEWWRDSCIAKQRKCWVIYEDDQIAGLIVRKDEKSGDTDAKSPGSKILKICTFKVRPISRGEKIGELLLKKAFWFCRKNRYDVIYLTTFEDQSALIDLLRYYGFKHTYTNDRGEWVFEKTIHYAPVQVSKGDDPYVVARTHYPTPPTNVTARSYVIPIKEAYHDKLFPELKDDRQGTLFDSDSSHQPKKPGNTIRKVYLCRTPMNTLDRGALLFFYKSKSVLPPSQAMTALGIFEDLSQAESTEELKRLTGGRSVYSEQDLISMNASKNSPVKVINFLLYGYIEPALSLREARSMQILNGAPISFTTIQTSNALPLLGRVDLAYSV